jgi:hypothetical protein
MHVVHATRFLASQCRARKRCPRPIADRAPVVPPGCRNHFQSPCAMA